MLVQVPLRARGPPFAKRSHRGAHSDPRSSERACLAIPRRLVLIPKVSMRHLLLALLALTLAPGVASADINTPILWYAANVGLEGYACGSCGAQSFDGCGCKGWLTCQAGICEPAGGYGEACRPNDDRPVKTGCLESLGCVDDACVPIGSKGEVCRRESYYYNPLLQLTGQNPNQWPSNCDSFLSCANGYCQTTPPALPPPPPPCAGAKGCECRRPAERYIEGCDPGLFCDQHKNCRDIFDLALGSAYASQAIYDVESGDLQSMQAHLNKAGNLQRVAYSGQGGWLRDVEAGIASNNDVIVVAVAGSESAQDWIANMGIADISWWVAMFPVTLPFSLFNGADLVDPLDEYDGGWAPCSAQNQAACYTRLKVHVGFLAYAHDLYRNFLKRALRTEYDKKHRPIQLVGHSLGGAVAQLLAAQIVTDMNLPVDAVVTFGSPKVGDANWELVYESLLHRATHRWVVQDDPVPNLPASDDWKRAGQQHYLQSTLVYQPVLTVRQTYELDSRNHAKSFHDVEIEDHYLMDSYVPALEALNRCDPWWQSC